MEWAGSIVESAWKTDQWDADYMHKFSGLNLLFLVGIFFVTKNELNNILKGMLQT